MKTLYIGRVVFVCKFDAREIRRNLLRMFKKALNSPKLMPDPDYKTQTTPGRNQRSPFH